MNFCNVSTEDSVVGTGSPRRLASKLITLGGVLTGAGLFGAATGGGFGTG